MRAYALHLYSNRQPGADWFLEGLEHFSLAPGCQLLFFLIHHPEDDEVLATMIEKSLPHRPVLRWASGRGEVSRQHLFYTAMRVRLCAETAMPPNALERM